MKVKFRIPQTDSVIVRWFRKGVGFTETLIDRPANNEMLRITMLGHKVGYSEIRAVKSVDGTDLQQAITNNFGRRVRLS